MKELLQEALKGAVKAVFAQLFENLAAVPRGGKRTNQIDQFERALSELRDAHEHASKVIAQLPDDAPAAQEQTAAPPTAPGEVTTPD